MTPDEHTIHEHMLGVGDGHDLYVQEWGQRSARRTFLYLHGGPGSGCRNSAKALFDGTSDHVVFFDQRGAGKSTPAGALEQNTTGKLVDDITRVLDTLVLPQVTLVGGSWGSCLALAYALAHPERVDAMILRGLFTGTQAEIDHLEQGAFRLFYPEVWDTFTAAVPEAHRHNPAAYYHQLLAGNDPAAATEAAYAFSEMEGAVSTLDDRHTPEDPATFSLNRVRIETHYFRNHCFLQEGHIMAHARALTMPVWLVQGRYDMACAPATAYALHKQLPNSQLIFTVSGHSGSDRGNFDAVRSIIRTLR
jgi:proline iminopeptidase